MRLTRHPRQPGQHVAGVARIGRQVPRVDQYGRVLVRAVGEEFEEGAVVEVAVAKVVADVDAVEAFPHRLGDHRAGRLGVLERHLAQRGQPAGGVRGVPRQMPVDGPAPVGGPCRFQAVAEQQRRAGQHLHVDAEPVEVGDAGGRVPQGAAHRPVLGGPGHHHSGVGAVRGAQPRAVLKTGDPARLGAADLGEDVRVDVDDGHAPPASSRRVRGRSCSGQSLPGWRAPQRPQVRAAVSA